MGLWAALLLLLLAAGSGQMLWAQHEHHAPESAVSSTPAGPPAQGSAPPPEAQREVAQEKRFSEFNHRLAGFFVLLVGLLVLAEEPLSRRRPAARYIWPAFLFLPGLYLFFLSDPEAWPVGPETLRQVITSNTEALQHKAFSLLLLALGAVEYLRLRGRIRQQWTAAVFPVLAVAGSVLLLFHPHNAGQHQPGHMEAMARIQAQHLAYTVVGLGIALAKAAGGAGSLRRRNVSYAWPVLMMVLGALLLGYRE